MARHENVSCDSCVIESFKGKRYKCLLCYDYDLCEMCFESNAATALHVASHPMQCILTRNDSELYYFGGSTLQLAFTCPFCGQKGFSEIELADHVTSTHENVSSEVICPICCCAPRGIIIQAREDFISHLNLDHRNQSRDLISFFDENPRQGIRRMPVPNPRLNSARGRRSNINFNTQNNRDSSDSIAEILTHLSGTRRAQGNAVAPTQQADVMQVRGRHAGRIMKKTVGVTPQSIGPSTAEQSGISLPSQQNMTAPQSPLLLRAFLTPRLSEKNQIKLEEERADRSLFVSRLLLNILTEHMNDPVKNESS